MADFLLTETSKSFDSINRLFNGTDRLRVPLTTSFPGAVSGYYVTVSVEPAKPTTAVEIAITGETTYKLGAAALTGGAHIIGLLGRVFNFNNGTMPLCIGVEGRIDNTNTGTTTTAICLDANFSGNLATVGTLYGTFFDILDNLGTINSAVALSLNVEGAAGTITSVVAVLVPTLTTPAGIGTLYGLFFNNNPSIASKFCVLCLDAGAVISTIGPIVTTGKTTTNTFQLDTGTKTATAVAGAATLNKASGKITSEALVTAAGASYTLTLSNSQIAAVDTVFASVDNGTNTTPDATVTRVTPDASSVVIVVKNTNAGALNGTIVISFVSMKA